MNRSLIAITAAVTLIGLAGGSQLTGATASPSATKSAAIALIHHRPFWGEAPCKAGADIKVKSFYKATAHYPNRIMVRIKDAEPNTRFTFSVAVYQGDSGSATLTHRRTDEHGHITATLSGTAGYHQVDVTATSPAGERCELEISGIVTPLP